ncbi:MAG: T9SS type A sorting domain-containing protein [Bacteroidetes bacterium]|nr:T9SS type A sorting domain-containing protein [Bacteroidota bacterium]
MKKIVIICLTIFSALASIVSEGQPYCTYRMANPRIYRSIGNLGIAQRTRLTFDIYVKCSAANTYYYGCQVGFNLGTAANFNGSGQSPNAINVDISTGILAGHPAYIISSQGWNSGSQFGVSTKVNGSVYEGGAVETYMVPLTTSYQLLQTVGVEITSTGASSGMAELTFDLTSMVSITQTYMVAGELIYDDPLHYYGNAQKESPEFSNLYLGRMYCNKWGWSEYINAGSDVQPSPQWTTNAYNTSVWDTTTFMGSSGAAAPISTLYSLANGLRVHQYAHLQINSGASLTCSGSTDINEPVGLIIQATSSGLGQYKDNGTINYNNGGYVQPQLYLAQQEWHFYCIPLQTTFSRPYHWIYMKWYDETRSDVTTSDKKWRYVINDKAFGTGASMDDSALNVPMKGFAMWSSSGWPAMGNWTGKPGGKLFTTNQTFTCTHNLSVPSGGDGWNLIGNPFPCTIDLTGINTWASSGVVQNAWFWDSGAGNYKTWILDGNSAGTRATSYCPPEQGFFVHCTGSGNGVLTIPASSRTVINLTTQPWLKEINAIPDLLRMKVERTDASAPGSNDEANVIFLNSASRGYDPDFDAFKLYGNADAPQLYMPVAQDTLLTVNALPWSGVTQVIPVSFRIYNTDGSFTFTARNLDSFHSNVTIFLEDKRDNFTQNLITQPEYNFTAAVGDNPDRFLLHFANPNFGISENASAAMQIYSFEEYVYVKNLAKGTTMGTIQMFDLLGKKVFQAQLKDVELNKFLPGVNSGYYMVKVVTDEKLYNQKVYLK